MQPAITPEDLQILLEAGQQNSGLQRQLDMQHKQAEALRAVGDDSPQGQMVSGHYIAPSWTKYAAQVAGGAGAGKMGREALATGGAMDANTGRQNQTALAAIIRAMSGGPPAAAVDPAPKLPMLGQPGY